MTIKNLVGSGDKIGMFTLPFLAVGVILNLLFPSVFSVGGPPAALRVISIILLVPGVAVWIWTAVLILIKVPKKELISGGPYAVVKHPLYLNMSLLVLPWLGFLFNSWLGVALGIVLYVGSRLFSPAEEKLLSQTFGAAWEDYGRKVILPWL
jgi:protein-S-isoprenylcysteine O-methyltransferase Ste14